MEKRHYIQIGICSLICLIAGALFSYYYREYIAPESYVIGSISDPEYIKLEIKDYLSDETVLFSQDINDVTFANENGVATYVYNFAPTEFNGIKNDYIIYVNNNMLSNITQNAGTISGDYILNYYDVELNVLCSSVIDIDFTFYSLTSKLQVSLPADQLGYLMNYFNSDTFIITLAHNPFDMQNKDGESNEARREIDELKATITTMNETIAQLEAKKTELESSNSSLENSNAEKDSQIASLNTQIADLEYQVDYLTQLLAMYENEGKIDVSFRVGSDAYNVQFVESGATPEVPVAPVVEGKTFLGWSVDGVNLVDAYGYVITEPTTFIAIFEDKIQYHTFKIMNGDEVYYTKEVVNGGSVSDTFSPTREGYTFAGYSLDGETIVELQTTDITSDLTYYAMFGYYEEDHNFADYTFMLELDDSSDEDLTFKADLSFVFEDLGGVSELSNLDFEFMLSTDIERTTDDWSLNVYIYELDTEYVLDEGNVKAVLDSDGYLTITLSDVYAGRTEIIVKSTTFGVYKITK